MPIIYTVKPIINFNICGYTKLQLALLDPNTLWRWSWKKKNNWCMQFSKCCRNSLHLHCEKFWLTILACFYMNQFLFECIKNNVNGMLLWNHSLKSSIFSFLVEQCTSPSSKNNNKCQKHDFGLPSPNYGQFLYFANGRA